MDSMKKYNVLIIEDTENWREHISQVLADYNVTIAGDVGSALDALLLHRSTPFHVAIVDLRLEGDKKGDESGFEIAKKIKRAHPKCQIIILTGYGDVSNSVEAFKEMQVFDFLEKFPAAGFDNQRLRSTVAEAILQIPPSSGSEKTIRGRRAKQRSVVILHLSDLHCGPTNRFTEGDPRMPDRMPRIAKMVVNDVNNLNLSPDAIVISGDLTDAAKAHEFHWARKFVLNPLLSGLSLSKRQIVVVPGDHDIEWIEGDEYLPAETPHGNYTDSYQLFYDRDPEDPKRLFHICYLEDKNLLILGLDSCVIENSTNAGIGFVGPRQREVVLKRIHELTEGHDDCVKLAILHHHLMPVEDIKELPKQGQKFSLVMDAQSVLRFLYRENFLAVLHGHQHQPYYTEVRLHSVPERSSPMAIIGAGSIGARRDALGNIARNHYNILEITTSDGGAAIRIIGRMSSDQAAEDFQPYGEEVIINFNGDLGRLT